MRNSRSRVGDTTLRTAHVALPPFSLPGYKFSQDPLTTARMGLARHHNTIKASSGHATSRNGSGRAVVAIDRSMASTFRILAYAASDWASLVIGDGSEEGDAGGCEPS